MNRSRVVTAATGAVVAVQHPVLLGVCVITVLLLLTAVIGTAALSRKKYRRDAACNVIELVLGLAHRNRIP
ncbi:MAG: hypothetical protein ACRDTC_09585 [Pseudonocardiaceae bacterium]